MSLIVAFALASGMPAAAVPKAAAPDAAALRDIEKILQEASRQEQVSGAMAGAIADFRKLVNDLQANALLTEAKGEELVAVAETLDATDRSNVRVAAGKLRDAGRDSAGRQKNLSSAETEIQTALERLQALLRQANALQAGEMVNALIAKIIEEQERVTAKSTDLGKELLAEAATLSQQPEDLAREQQRVADRAAQLEDLLKKALADEMTASGRERLREAATIMEEERVRGRLGVAAESVRTKDLMHAVAEQKLALDALRRMAKALSPDAPVLTQETREKLSEILKAQSDLRDKTAKLPKDQFDKAAPDLQLLQKDLENRLKEALKAMQESKLNAKAADEKKGGKAPDEKKGGEGKVNNKSNQEIAAKPFESKMQGNATGGFGKAGDNPPPSKPREEGGSDPTDKAGAGPEKAMVEADKALSQKQQENAVTAQRNAEQALQDMLKAMEQQLLAQQQRPPKKQTGNQPMNARPSKPQKNAQPTAGPPSPNQAPPPEDDQDQQAKNDPDLLPMPAPPDPGTKGRKDFVKTGVYGARPANEHSQWDPLSRGERDALSQNFARELPREYRDMLRAYYEKLARQ